MSLRLKKRQRQGERCLVQDNYTRSGSADMQNAAKILELDRKAVIIVLQKESHTLGLGLGIKLSKKRFGDT